VGRLLLGTASLLLSEKPIKRDTLCLSNNVANLISSIGKGRRSRLVSRGFISLVAVFPYGYP